MPEPPATQSPSAAPGDEPSGYKGDSVATAGPGNTNVTSPTPEKAAGKLDPSAPGNTGTTPGTDGAK